MAGPSQASSSAVLLPVEEGRALWSSGAPSYFSSLDMARSSSCVSRVGGVAWMYSTNCCRNLLTSLFAFGP
jgi:hypothetical protein